MCVLCEVGAEGRAKEKEGKERGRRLYRRTFEPHSELLYHLLATCDPADIMDALPDLMSVITASCLPRLPDSPLVEELDIKEFMART